MGSFETTEIDVLIVGAGVLGLACAESLARANPRLSIAVIDRHSKFGWETSSHNSEVVHAGIYYDRLPNKARFCLAGRERLYEHSARHGVPHAVTGKYIVATDPSQIEALEGIFRSASNNGVALERVPRAKIADELNNSSVAAALFSPRTGIVDSHSLMRSLESLASTQGTAFLYGHRLTAIEDIGARGLEAIIEDPSRTRWPVRCRALVNACGLAADRVARLCRVDIDCEIRPCRGRYFKLSSRWTSRYSRLIYPVPDPAGGLGVHLTFDLNGQSRLGPDVDWQTGSADNPDLYRFESAPEELRRLRDLFHASGKKLFPDLEPDHLSPDYIGVRPKLFIRGEPHRDFLIHVGKNNDWHLLGIESPGLTASLALGDEIARAILGAL